MLVRQNGKYVQRDEVDEDGAAGGDDDGNKTYNKQIINNNKMDHFNNKQFYNVKPMVSILLAKV